MQGVAPLYRRGLCHRAGQLTARASVPVVLTVSYCLNQEKEWFCLLTHNSRLLTLSHSLSCVYTWYLLPPPIFLEEMLKETGDINKRPDVTYALLGKEGMPFSTPPSRALKAPPKGRLECPKQITLHAPGPTVDMCSQVKPG